MWALQSQGGAQSFWHLFSFCITHNTSFSAALIPAAHKRDWNLFFYICISPT